MAALLGSEFCINSLRRDVQDLQTAVTDVFSRAGPAPCRSWKYPDKLSSEVDMDGLLEDHHYSPNAEDEEDCQVAHIVLLELVVDRLVLLLHATSRYMDGMLNVSGTASTTQQADHSSIGLIATKYWGKMVAVSSNIKQLQSENKSKSRKNHDLQSTIAEMDKELENMHTADSVGAPIWSPEITSALVKSGILSPQRQEELEIAKDEYNKSTQTVDTAFVPCESCHRVQCCLFEVGDNITNICNSQYLPSALSIHKAQVKGMDWLTANDVIRWTSEQNKDLSRVNQHLSHLHSTIQPLEHEIRHLKKEHQRLEEKAEQASKMAALEKNTTSTLQKQYENKIKQVESEGRDAKDAERRREDDFARSKAELQVQLADLHKTLTCQKQDIHQLENVKSKLESDLDEALTNNADVKKLQDKLNVTKVKLDSVNKELLREQAKSTSVNKHTQSLAGKQAMLVDRLDDLDKENAELRDLVNDLESDKDSLEVKQGEVKDEVRQLKDDLRKEKAVSMTLSCEKQDLVQSADALKMNVGQLQAKVEELQEKQRMLIEYPDLNGPINRDLAGTGNLIKDMENQVQANNERIRLLEVQSNGLRNSISKILTSQAGQQPRQAFTSPVSLWQSQPNSDSSPECVTTGSECRDWDHTTRNDTTNDVPLCKVAATSSVRESFVVSRGPPRPDSKVRSAGKARGSGSSSRPASGTRSDVTAAGGGGARTRPGSARTVTHAPLPGSKL